MIFLLRFIIAVVFLFAGWFSNANTEFVEYIFVDAGWSNWFLTPYLSRIFIGSALSMALLLLFMPGQPKIIIKSSIALVCGFLLINILQPTILELTRCYVCLSEIEKISRYQGIWLWLIVLALLILLLKLYRSKKGWLPAWPAWIFLISGLSIPFILNYPSKWAVYGEVAEKPMDRDLQLSRLDTVTFDTGNHVYDPSVWKGKRLLVLASLTCPYCSRAAYKLHILRKQNPDYPVTVLLEGDVSGLPTFVKRHVFNNVPYQLMNHPVLAELCEGRVPRIFVVENGIAKTELQYWSIGSELP